MNYMLDSSILGNALSAFIPNEYQPDFHAHLHASGFIVDGSFALYLVLSTSCSWKPSDLNVIVHENDKEAYETFMEWLDIHTAPYVVANKIIQNHRVFPDCKPIKVSLERYPLHHWMDIKIDWSCQQNYWDGHRLWSKEIKLTRNLQTIKNCDSDASEEESDSMIMSDLDEETVSLETENQLDQCVRREMWRVRGFQELKIRQEQENSHDQWTYISLNDTSGFVTYAEKAFATFMQGQPPSLLKYSEFMTDFIRDLEQSWHLTKSKVDNFNKSLELVTRLEKQNLIRGNYTTQSCVTIMQDTSILTTIRKLCLQLKLKKCCLMRQEQFAKGMLSFSKNHFHQHLSPKLALCGICLANTVEQVFINCGHLLCIECGSNTAQDTENSGPQIYKCPFCFDTCNKMTILRGHSI